MDEQGAMPIETFCQWQEARESAAENGIPWHPPWNDFHTFLNDLGECPEDSHLECASEFFGYVPGHCNWAGADNFPESYADCPVSMGLLHAGLIEPADAMAFAYLDADPEFVRSSVAELDRKTAGQNQETRRAAVAVLLNELVKAYGRSPKGYPNRWQIRQWTKRLRAEAFERKRDEVEPSEFEADPNGIPDVEFVADTRSA